MSIIVRSNDPTADAKVNAPEPKAEVSSDVKTSAQDVKASEQKEPGDSEPSGTESANEGEEPKVESDERESEQDTDSDEKTEEGAEKEKAGKGKSGFRKRIDKLNARVTAREQEIEYWRQMALKGAPAAPSKTDAPVDPAKAAPEASEGKPKADDFTTHGEYVEALTEWKTDQKLKERDAKLEREKLANEQKTKASTYSERAKAFSAKQDDFNDVLGDVDDIPLSPAVKDIILQAENGPELAYELAKNREEYARVCKLPPLQAAREMGKLEVRIASRASEGKQPETKITKAPKPLDPVGTGGKGSTGKSITDPNLSQAEYERLRREQTKRRRT